MKSTYIFMICLLLCGCGAPPSFAVESGLEGRAGPVDVFVNYNSEGFVVAGGGVTIPLIGIDSLGVGWRTGITMTWEFDKSYSNYLYIIYEDDNQEAWRQTYDIGIPFQVMFQENEWVKVIEKRENGSIIVVVEYRESGSGSPSEIREDETDSGNAQNITAGSCPGAEPQRVQVGDTIRICTKSDNVIVRERPEKTGNEIFRIAPDTYARIIDGPSCANSSSWWRIEVERGTWVRRGSATSSKYQLGEDTTGWVREGSDATDRYFICDVN